MQTFLPLLFIWDENKSLLENLRDYFIETAKVIDNKRTGKQRVEAKQLLNILLDRNTSSAWKNHPVLKMWIPWSEALKLYYNCFVNEWISRGFRNNMLYEAINEEALEFQSIPLFITNKHFVNRMKANLLSKDENFYNKYKWNVQAKTGYYWLLDGIYYLTKYNKRYEVDLSTEEAPSDPNFICEELRSPQIKSNEPIKSTRTKNIRCRPVRYM